TEFQEPLQFAAGDAPNRLRAGELNGDGKPDLITLNGFDSTISILLGKGTGAYPTHVEYHMPGVPSDVAIADFNGDRIPDLAVTSGNKFLSILLGKGDGTFQPRMDFTAGRYPGAIAVGDFNGDGNLDLAITELNPKVDVFLGSGNGSFPTYVSYDTG